MVVVLIAANVVVFGALAMVWLAARQVTSAVSTIPADSLELSEEPAALLDPRTFLLIGSDSRENLDDLSNFGDIGGERADVVILVQLLPAEDRVQLLSLPRDLKVPWGDGIEKMNATFALGGAAGIVESVQSQTGLPVHHYVQVDFAGFAGIVDAVGGIQMTFPFPARDLKSGLAVEAGTRLLDGQTALALARSRKYEEFRDGAWVSIEASDIGRTRRQQDLLLAIVTQLDRPSSITGYTELLDALGEFVTTDNALDTDDIIQLAWEMRSIEPEGFDAATLPVEELRVDGISYVVERQPLADSVLEAFSSGLPLSGSEGLLRVEVENGSGRDGGAATMAETLTAKGYEVVAAINSGREDYQLTLVLARPSLLDSAQELVDDLGFGTATVGRVPTGADLVVIVGADAPAPG